MIEKLFRSPHILHQTPDSRDDAPNAPVAGCIDASGTLLLSQEGREICVNCASVPELKKMLTILAKETNP